MNSELLIKNGWVIDPANGSTVPGKPGRSKEELIPVKAGCSILTIYSVKQRLIFDIDY